MSFAAPFGLLVIATLFSGLGVSGLVTKVEAIDRLAKFFVSLRWTVILLVFGLILVFWGTLAQVNLGLYKAQNEFFRSFVIYWQPGGGSLRIPVFPGGYLVGGLLIINLFAAHLRYYKPGAKKYGIVMIHLGIVLLLVGQFATDLLSTESSMHLRVGDTKNYSEADRAYELAVVDTTDAQADRVLTIAGHRLQPGREVPLPGLPFTVKVKQYFINSALSDKPQTNLVPVEVNAGIGMGLWWTPLAHETEMNKRDIPSGTVELATPQGSIGTWLISGYLARPQEIKHEGRTYQISLRPERYYKPFSLHLLEFRHDKYPGTDIPKNFSSRVRLSHPEKKEDREVLIYMNSPLRYSGETYYQASFDQDNQGSILQVVRNPSWLTPYFACVLVSIGMIYQFLSHLIGFAVKRKAA
jgi:hypothetical protein